MNADSGKGEEDSRGATLSADPKRAFDELYAELRRIADSHFRNRQQGSTLQPTALVHEAFIKLSEHTRSNFRDRDHFLAVVATAMRQILVDYARKKMATKRGGRGRTARDDAVGDEPPKRVPLTESIEQSGGKMGLDDLLSLEEALVKLAELDRAGRKVQIVELKYFAGLENEEVAKVLDISIETVKKEWKKTKAWLVTLIGNPPS